MPKVSIIALGQSESDLDQLKDYIRIQTFQDYEFIIEVGEMLSETWKRAIELVIGEILVMIDPNARPVNDRWLVKLVEGIIDANTVVKGLEIIGSFLNPSSLAGYRQAFINQ
jgi:hypothetical protein